jgi:hypothetical protein
MAVSTNYHNGVPCYVVSGVSSYTLPACEVSEPMYVRNEGTDILTLNPQSNQTIDSSASLSISPNDSVLINPVGTNWVTILNQTDTLSINQIGYTSGSGGSVTQTGTINSAVTLNKPCGKITLVSHDFSNNDIQQFTLNNSFIGINDVVAVTFRSGNAKLYTETVVTTDGSCNITVGDAHNQSTGAIAVILNFAIIKGDS